MKIGILRIISLVVAFFFIFSLLPQTSAAVVWSDNFDDGNYTGWTIGHGDYEIRDGNLYSHYVDSGSSPWRIWNASSIVEGTWSFDFNTAVEYPVFEHTILFMANGTDTTFNYDGYGIRLIGSTMILLKFDDGSDTQLSAAIIGGMEDWVHVDITRNSTGTLNVFVNATSSTAEPDISVVDLDYSYSERFVIHHNKEGFRFDNVVVSDTIDILPPAPTTPTDTTTTTTETTTDGETPPPIDTILLLVGAGVAGVVIKAAVVCLKRR